MKTKYIKPNVKTLEFDSANFTMTSNTASTTVNIYTDDPRHASEALSKQYEVGNWEE